MLPWKKGGNGPVMEQEMSIQLRKELDGKGTVQDVVNLLILLIPLRIKRCKNAVPLPFLPLKE